MATHRRNPPRLNRPPRRADSPVSFAVMGPLAASQDLSDSSDIELLEGPPVGSSAPPVVDLPDDGPTTDPLSLNVLRDHFRYSSTDSSTDSDEPSTGVPPRLRAFPVLSPLLSPRNSPDPSIASFMRQVDAPGLLIQERASLLIEEIYCLQGTIRVPNRQPSPTVVLDASPPHETPPQDSLYFVGLQTLTGSQSFCQRLTLIPPDRSLLSRLTEAGFPLGRTLGMLVNHHEYLVGTADIPVEISGDYMAIRNNFQELGSWHELETALESSLASLVPIPDSNVRMDLLSARRLNQSTPLYVLYIYHQESRITLFIETEHLFLEIGGESSLFGGNYSTSCPRCFRAYTDSHTYNRITDVLATPYGTGYKQCLIERYGMQICGALNIIYGRQIIPSSARGFSIRPEHVAEAAGVNLLSFSGMRTKFAKVRQARRLLQGYQYQNQPTDAGGERDAQQDKFQFLLAVLEKMLAETVLPHGAVGLVESEVVSMSISPFMTDIEEVISTLN
ncbi:hypothetical protein C8J57DRAFT_1532429 [Mycena rebaudengoi]|nr:hypothetical protein C8J57DRAFT_1532429 [Mycena rebaudengoi]